MAADYRVKTVKEAGGEPDQYGVVGYWVTFEGHENSALMRAKNAPVVGGMEYGNVTKETSKAGKEYYKFKREQREDGAPSRPTSTVSSSPKKEWVDHSDDIKAQWAIGQAVAWCIAHPSEVFDDIEAQAKEFYAMIDRVKDSEDKPSGYEAFKSAGGQVKSEALAKGEELPPTDAYADVVIEEFEDAEIDLSQIPF